MTELDKAKEKRIQELREALSQFEDVLTMAKLLSLGDIKHGKESLQPRRRSKAVKIPR